MNRTFSITIEEDEIMQILAMLHGDTEVNLQLSNLRFVENDLGTCALVATSILTDDTGELVKFNKRGLVIELEQLPTDEEELEEEPELDTINEYLGYR